MNPRPAIYLLERNTVKRFTFLLLVAAFSASSLTTLHCQWVCAQGAKTQTANSHCHDDDGTGHGARVSADPHACDHALTTIVALKGPAAGSQALLSPALAAPSMPLRFVASAAQVPANDTGPPGGRSLVSPGSILPLRI